MILKRIPRSSCNPSSSPRSLETFLKNLRNIDTNMISGVGGVSYQSGDYRDPDKCQKLLIHYCAVLEAWQSWTRIFLSTCRVVGFRVWGARGSVLYSFRCRSFRFEVVEFQFWLTRNIG